MLIPVAHMAAEAAPPAGGSSPSWTVTPDHEWNPALGVTTSGSDITDWDDQQGTRHLDTYNTGDAPHLSSSDSNFNSKDVADFDGNQSIRTASSYSSDDYFALVMAFRKSTTALEVLASEYTGGGTLRTFILNTTSSNYLQLQVYDAVGTFRTLTATTDQIGTTTNYVVGMRLAPMSFDVWLSPDGATVANPITSSLYGYSGAGSAPFELGGYINGSHSYQLTGQVGIAAAWRGSLLTDIPSAAGVQTEMANVKTFFNWSDS